jgi:hypothetical protein
MLWSRPAGYPENPAVLLMADTILPEDNLQKAEEKSSASSRHIDEFEMSA